MSKPTLPFPLVPENERPQEVWIITPSPQRWWLYVLFFALTMFSTLVVGARMQFNFMQHQPVFSLSDDSLPLFPLGWILLQPSNLLRGIPFSLTLMLILLAHEMGHYLYARHYRAYATPPFFIPFPYSFIGTLGAFIRIKSPIPSRAALFDIGIAGPIAGFIPACIALFVGLSLSRPIPAPNAPYIELGFPLAFHLAAGLLHLANPLSALSLHPIAVAAWVGMFATSLNLLPSGQLDGGHIVFSISPRLHQWVSVLAVLALVPLGRYFWSGWFFWAAMLVIMRRHPDVPHRPSVSGVRRWISVLALLMLTLTFTRVPLTPHPDQKLWPELRDDARDAIHWLRDYSRRLIHRK
jgi:Zn-dependent protease